MQTLLLVDGSSYLYRAFHALPDLRNAQQEPTGAIYGVLNMLRRLRKDYPAQYAVCVFDAKGKTFRHDLYPEYKAHRPRMPDDLAAQIEPLQTAIRAMGWPILSQEGVEADDVIASLATRADQEQIRTIISTGDKDLAQLVNANITLVNTMSNELLDEAGVIAKFGVPPALIVDYLTLIGDKVDNIPGVEKCGPKTAVKWLNEYQSLDQLIAHADQIGGTIGEHLRRAIPALPNMRNLIVVQRHLETPAWSALAWQIEDSAQLLALLQRFGFKSWYKEASGAVLPPHVAPSRPPHTDQASFLTPSDSTHYQAILDDVHWQQWLQKLEKSPLICLDTETTDLDPMQAELVGLSFCLITGEAAYLPLRHRYPNAPTQLNIDSVLAQLKSILEDTNRPKVGQNLKYDQQVLANYGIQLRGITHDTLLQSYVLENYRSHSMDDLAARHLGIKTITYEEVTGKGVRQIGFDQVAIADATRYAAEDADCTLRLHQVLYPQISCDSRLNFVYREIEIPVLSVLARIERNGVLLDTKMLHRQSHELGLQLLELEQQAHVLAGQVFNLNSPKQLQEILFNKLAIKPIKKTPGGTPSTDEDVLQKLAQDHPLPKLLLHYRSLAKLKSTYTDKLPHMVHAKTGRVHTHYNQAMAVTGRLASNDPNLQNIPVRTIEGRRIRESFIAPTGSWIVSADYSQIELRLMAHFSSDDNLLTAFAAGQDIHNTTAAEIFNSDPNTVTPEQRRYAKTINFGLIYGMSAFGLAGQLNIDRTTAQQYIDRYFARYPGVARYMQSTRDLARTQGYVETWFGRRLWFPEINSQNAIRRQGAERAAINAPLQGTAADLIKLAMIALDHWLTQQQLTSKIIMQVHDELVLEVPDNELIQVQQHLPTLMSQAAQLSVPLEVVVGVGKNWECAH